VLIRCKFCGKKVFQKIQDGGWNEKTRLNRLFSSIFWENGLEKNKRWKN
jgi:hypothetical protein